jgi:hypothetical protein
VYGIISLIVYSWTLLEFFWRLPSWEFYMSVGDIAVQFAYSMATNFLESLTVLAGLLFLCAIVPARWFKDLFLSVGSLLVILGLAYFMYFAIHSTSRDDTYPTSLVRSAPAVAALILIVSMGLGRVPLIRRVMDGLADRATIFSYVLPPIGAVSLLIVIARNILKV